MEITRDELLESGGTEVNSTTPTKLDQPSKRKKNVSPNERIQAHREIFQNHMQRLGKLGKQPRGEKTSCNQCTCMYECVYCTK